MKKKRDVGDMIFVAERQDQRMLENVSNRIIDKAEIVSAIQTINTAHYIAMKENKRELI